VTAGEFRVVERADFELVGFGSAVVVISRYPGSPTAVRSYGLDGSELGQADVEADARLIATPDGSLLVISARDGVLSGRRWNAALSYEGTSFAFPFDEMPLLLGAVQTGVSTIVFTEAGFVNATLQNTTTWTNLLADEADASSPTPYGRIYGAMAVNDGFLVAWGQNGELERAVVDSTGALIDHALDRDFIPNPGYQNAVAHQFGGTLLLLHGNPVGRARIRGDTTLEDLGFIEDFRAFYRQAPVLGFARWNGRPLGVWFAVAPGESFYDGNTKNQIYGCELDLTASDACLRRFLVAEVDFNPYEIGEQPLAVAVVGASTLAVAHSDMNGGSWLRFVDLECALGPTAE
jgi:hypothetical protein